MVTNNADRRLSFGAKIVTGHISISYLLFWRKYIGKQHADHLIESIIKYYAVYVGCTGVLYCDIKLDCNHDYPRIFDLSMPKYLPNVLHELQHPYTKISQHEPHKF